MSDAEAGRQPASLYEMLGGEAAMRAFTGRFYALMDELPEGRGHDMAALLAVAVAAQREALRESKLRVAAREPGHARRVVGPQATTLVVAVQLALLGPHVVGDAAQQVLGVVAPTSRGPPAGGWRRTPPSPAGSTPSRSR